MWWRTGDHSSSLVRSMNMESCASASRRQASIFSSNSRALARPCLCRTLLISSSRRGRRATSSSRALRSRIAASMASASGEGKAILRPADARPLRLPLDRRQRRARAAHTVEPSLLPAVLLCLVAEEGRRRLKAADGVPAGGALALLVVVTRDAVA